MKIKDYLKKLLEKSVNKSLVGKELKVIEPYFENIDELKDKKVEIIEEISNVGEPKIKITTEGFFVKQETYPKLSTIKGFDGLKDNIKIYSIFLQNDDIYVRCSEDSIKTS